MGVVRGFAISTLVWGAVGMAVGLLAAVQLAPGRSGGHEPLLPGGDRERDSPAALEAVRVSSLALTIPATLLLAVALLVLVVRAVLRGEYDDWEGPAARHLLDEDACPEREDVRDEEPGAH